jgi:hypothetical protein
MNPDFGKNRFPKKYCILDRNEWISYRAFKSFPGIYCLSVSGKDLSLVHKLLVAGN